MKQCNNRKPHHGFTLLELLIVIAILGILAVGVITAINVIGNLNKATLARAKTFSSQVENALSINQVGKWSFDDPANLGKDTSGYGNDGVLNGPTSQNANQCGLGYGGCLSFDGVNDYVNIPHNATITPKGPFTVAAWVQLNSTGNGGQILDKANGDNPGDRTFAFYANSSSLTLAIYGNASSTFIGRTASHKLNNNAWHYVVGVYEGGLTASGIKVYIDGERKDNSDVVSGSFTGIGTSVISLKIGSGYNSGVLAALFKGFIDEVSMFNQALTFSQIQQLYAQGLPRHQLARQ